MRLFKSLKVGEGYNKKDLAPLINEPKVKGLQGGLLYCDNRKTTILFVTLDKKQKEKQHHYNDYFDGDYFEWDSQNQQNFDSPRIQAMFKSEVDVHLMARVVGKKKGKTQPFIYCGELEYYSYEKSSKNPVHITFKCIDFKYEHSNEELNELYNWKPGDAGRLTTFKNDYKKTITEKRRRTYKEPETTERKGLVTSRVGQGYYREQVLEKWNYKCAVTECNIPKILIASHIVPWRDATKIERLDPENGILLSPNYDALFDKNLISFSDDGSIIISKNINLEDLGNLGINRDAKIEVNEEMKPFLQRHRNKLQ